MPDIQSPIKIALLDLYAGEKNQGIRAIGTLLQWFETQLIDRNIVVDQFDVRSQGKLPDLSYDLYISSGGPGSPYDGEGWESNYFNWVDELWQYNRYANESGAGLTPKHALFICHSFQLMCRHFKLGNVTKRRSPSFGIYAVHQENGNPSDPLFEGLSDPFYAADFRHWQVVEPDHNLFETLGAQIIAREKVRPHVPHERAIMGIRVSPEIVGVQFHPEADPPGMLVHFQQEKRRREIIDLHGEGKYQLILERLKDPQYLQHTYNTVIPNFLSNAIQAEMAETTG